MRIEYTARNEEIRRLRKEGMTYKALAEKYDVSIHRIEEIVKKPLKDTLGLSPEVYYPLKRGMIRQNGSAYENFTLKELEYAIEEGLPVHNIGETKVKELSDIFGREVTLTREYDTKIIQGLLYKSNSYVVILRFKKEGA